MRTTWNESKHFNFNLKFRWCQTFMFGSVQFLNLLSSNSRYLCLFYKIPTEIIVIIVGVDTSWGGGSAWEHVTRPLESTSWRSGKMNFAECRVYMTISPAKTSMTREMAHNIENIHPNKRPSELYFACLHAQSPLLSGLPTFTRKSHLKSCLWAFIDVDATSEEFSKT